MRREFYLSLALIWVGVMIATIWSMNQIMAVATNDFFYPTCQTWSGRCDPLWVAGGVLPVTIFLVALFGYFYCYRQVTRR